MAKADVALNEYYVATAALRVGDRNGADEHYRACLAIREALASDPKSKLTATDLMLAQARCGQHEKASRIAGDLIRNPPLDAPGHFFAACGYALSGAVAELPKSKENLELYRRYVDGAFLALRFAREHGWKGLADVETDPDLDPIRGEPEYAAMVESFRKVAGR